MKSKIASGTVFKLQTVKETGIETSLQFSLMEMHQLIETIKELQTNMDNIRV